MDVATFFEKFELLAETPNAVEKMRKLVLDLAISGNLGSTEPGSWTPRQLRDVARLISGQHLLADQHNSDGRGIPYLTGPSDFGRETPIPTRWTEQPKVIAEPGDILITVKGSGVGKTNVLVDQPTAIGRQLMAIRVTKADRDFIHLAVRRAAAHFQALKTGIAIPGIGRDDVLKLPLLLPPLAEQKRIVAKVDELMALCDRLESQQRERDEKQATLARASLARFTEAPTPANLNFLFHKSYSIDPADLRKTILTLAMRGKLVGQDERDEDAASLLQEVGAARPTLAKSQNLRLPKQAAVPSCKDIPHAIPDSWAWSRIGALAVSIDYGTSSKACEDSSKVPIYRMGNIAEGQLLNEKVKYVDPAIKDLPAAYLKAGDILFNRTNSYELVGKSALYTGSDDVATYASYLIRIRLPSTWILPEYVTLALNSPYFRYTQIEPKVVQQCGQANFSGSKLGASLVPVPPLAEQRRIVAKAGKLLGMVEQIGAQIATSNVTADRLLETLGMTMAAPSVAH